MFVVEVAIKTRHHKILPMVKDHLARFLGGILLGHANAFAVFIRTRLANINSKDGGTCLPTFPNFDLIS